MTDMNVQSGQAAHVVRLLQAAESPLTAEVLGRRLRLHGSIETQRRRVRAIVQYLRDECSEWIIAFNPAGYWLTDDEQVWLDYCEGRKIDAKKILGKAHRRQKMITSDRGQGLLFVPATHSAIGTY